MAKKERIVRYSAKELAAKRKRGQTRSDWARAAAMTHEEIEADIASDPDEEDMVVDWDSKRRAEKRSAFGLFAGVSLSAISLGSTLSRPPAVLR